jgi:hypothetical protein
MSAFPRPPAPEHPRRAGPRRRKHRPYCWFLPVRRVRAQQVFNLPLQGFGARNRGDGISGNGSRLPTLSWPPTNMME